MQEHWTSIEASTTDIAALHREIIALRADIGRIGSSQAVTGAQTAPP